jgi:serine/threonine protein kinase
MKLQKRGSSVEMTPEARQHIQDLYDAARKHGRGILIDADPEVRRQVETLLNDDAATGVLNGPAFAGARITNGSRIGPYRIHEPLGSGGMGQVFNATDTRLDRIVAIKVCSERFSERFEREARTIAALNHPHICTLYDIGPDFLVMEKIVGSTVGDRLRAGPLRIDEAVLYGSQIADVLAEAHAHGIIHRDLKPNNVMIARHGVKVLDFGLAKSGSSPHEMLTQTGVVMGTPAYMAPEQFQGKDTHKADLFSLGLILYEMLTGRLPVPGASLGLMLTNRAVTFPPPASIVAGISADLDALVCGLLSARPEDRPQRAEEVRDRLSSLKNTGVSPKQWLVPTVIVSVLLILALIAGAWWTRDSGASSWKLVSLTKVTPAPGNKRDPAYSRDGAIAFSWSGEAGDQPGIYVIPRKGAVPIRITQSQTEDVSPRWSQDGKQIAFLRLHPATGVHELFVTSVDGALSVASVSTQERKIRGIKQHELLTRNLRPLLTWTPDGSAIVIPIYDAESARVSLFRVGFDGATRRLFPSRAGIGDTTPSYSTDGRQLVFTNLDGSNSGQLYVVAVGNDGAPAGEPIAVPGGTGSIISPTWSLDGTRLLFTRRSQLMEWKPGNMAQQIYVAQDSFQSMAVSWNTDGTPQILFANESHPPELQTLKFNAQAHKVESAPTPFLKLAGRTANPALSPNGKWIVFSSDASGEDRIWIAQADGRNSHPLCEINAGAGISWSGDSKHVAFHTREGSPVAQIYVIDIDDSGKGSPYRQISHSSFGLLGAHWSADDKYIYSSGTRGAVSLVVRLPSAGGDVEELFGGGNPIVSADGKHLLYSKQSDPGLFERSLDGNVLVNDERRLFEDWRGPAGYVPAEIGVLYVGRNAAGNPSAIRFFDYALRRSFDIAPPSVSSVPVMTLAPDGRTLVYETFKADAGDLTLMQFAAR